MKCHGRNLTVGDGNSLPFADPVQERQGRTLKRQLQDVDRWPLARRRRALTMAFFLLSGPDPRRAPGVRAPQAAADREGRSPARTRVRHLTRSRLLYFAAVLARQYG